MPDDTVTSLREQITELARARVPLQRIEAEVIDRAPLDDESRSALWLHAWHSTDGGYRPQATRFSRERPGP